MRHLLRKSHPMRLVFMLADLISMLIWSNDEEKKKTLNDFDSTKYENLIGEFLLELRENCTAVTCFVSEKFSAVINVDRKQDTKMFHRSYSKNCCEHLDYESKTILFSESPFNGPCEKFSKEKALSNHDKQKKKFHRPSWNYPRYWSNH